MNGALSNLIETIYSNVDRAEGWRETLSALTAVTGASSGCIVATHAADPIVGVNCFHNIDPAWIETYNRHYAEYDPSPRLADTRPGEVVVDHVTGPRPSDTKGNCRLFFHEVMRPQQFRHTMALGLAGDGGWKAGIVLQRTARQGGFDSGAVASLGKVTCHLRQSLQLHARLSQIAGIQAGMTAALDNSPLAVLLLDARGWPIFVNRRAGNLLKNTPALSITGEGLGAKRTADDKGLQALIHGALASARGRDGPGGGRMWIGDLLVNVTPMTVGEAGTPFASSGIYASVWLTPGSADITVSPRALREYYGLTRAESELVVWFVRGKTPAQAAEIRSVTLGTLRSQIKAIKKKVGVNRQADLVRTVLSGPAPSLFPDK